MKTRRQAASIPGRIHSGDSRERLCVDQLLPRRGAEHWHCPLPGCASADLALAARSSAAAGAAADALPTFFKNSRRASDSDVRGFADPDFFDFIKPPRTVELLKCRKLRQMSRDFCPVGLLV